MSHEQQGKVQRPPKPDSEREYQAEQRANRRRNRGTVEQADWKEAHPDKLARAIVAITSAGCAIQFGRTRDGGAFSVRIVGGGEPVLEYVRPTEDIDLYLDTLATDFADPSDK